LALAGAGITIAIYYGHVRWSMELIKIDIPTRAALIALVVLMGAAPIAEAKRWYDEDRGAQGYDGAPGYDSGSPENNPPRRDKRSRSDNAPQYDGGSRNGNAPRNDRRPRDDYAPREYYQQREQPSRSPGNSLDSAVARASREGRVLYYGGGR